MSENILNIAAALAKIIPEHCIIHNEMEIGKLTRDTSSKKQSINLILHPDDKEQIQKIVIFANKHQLKLYPVSTGCNWGYGTIQPPTSDCIVVILDRLKSIKFDKELGLISVEPGVTQSDLYAFFQKHDNHYMVPTTGAGPHCSIIGNALERGYGITPVADHFAAVMGLEVILPDGKTYRSPLLEKNFTPLLKWGIGPYLDGLFSQSNYGIVTEMTLVVEHKPESVQMFIATVRKNCLSSSINAIRSLLRHAKGNIGGINLMNAERLAIMNRDVHQGKLIKKKDSHQHWLIVGTIYGTKKHVQATRALVKKELSSATQRPLFISASNIKLVKRAANLLPGLFKQLKQTMSGLSEIFGLFEGRPSDISLRLAYYKNRDREKGILNPAKDHSGLLWYSPIVPMRARDFETFIEFIYNVCEKYNIDPAVTLTSLSANAFDCTLPLLFTPEAEEEKLAYKCYHELITVGRSLGFTPYRLHSRFMSEHFIRDIASAHFARIIKKAIDPNNVISPGRYE